jgi:hypothetical protein
MRVIGLHDNEIVDVSPLATMKKLISVNVSSNNIGGKDVGNIDLLATLPYPNLFLDLTENFDISCEELDILLASTGEKTINHDGDDCSWP